jgi:hypothetical protein
VGPIKVQPPFLKPVIEILEISILFIFRRGRSTSGTNQSAATIPQASDRDPCGCRRHCTNRMHLLQI